MGRNTAYSDRYRRFGTYRLSGTLVPNYHSTNGNLCLPPKTIYCIQQCSTVLHVSVYMTIAAIKAHDLKTSEMR
jgi:hypothetical protein